MKGLACEQQTYFRSYLRKITGTIHLTQISGPISPDNVPANRSRRTGLIPFPSRDKNFALIFKMADVVSLLPVLELVEDFEEINDIMDDDDDIVVFSAVSCFMRQNLTRISGYFEQTVPRYLPDEFRQHFRMTRETCEMLMREIVQTGHIPLGNAFGRQVIASEKPEVLTFLWSIGIKNRRARSVADRFDITKSSYDIYTCTRIFVLLTKFTRSCINKSVKLSTKSRHEAH